MYHVWKRKNGTPPRRKDRGFTLIEMLTVTAIIAVLVATSIPMVNNALERARIATDAANERAAKAAATIMFLTADDPSSLVTGDQFTHVFFADSGEILKFGSFLDSPSYGKCKDHKGDCIVIGFNENGAIDIHWMLAPSKPLHIDSPDLSLPPS